MKKLRDPKKKMSMGQKTNHGINYTSHNWRSVWSSWANISKDYSKLKEELGNLLFQVIYLSQIANEKKKFNFNEVVKNITEKMISRHPHAFNYKKFKSMNEFRNWWEKYKNKKYKSILDDIPITYAAMLRSHKIQKKVANVGFDYSSDIEAIDKIKEEVNELKKNKEQ